MKKMTALIFALLLTLALPACTKTAGDRANKALANAQHPTEKAVVIATGDNTEETTVPQKIETTSHAETTPSPTSGKADIKMITRERAIEIALEKAGLERNAVFELEAEFDKERNGTFWEVDFETREYEYSYHINAESGKVVKSDVTPEKAVKNNNPSATKPVTAPEITTVPTTKSELITRERAIEIALEKAGLERNAVFELEAELDKERNGTFWEVDFETREYEYSYEIDAENENIIHQKRELND